MIQAAMYFVLGLLTAGMLALLVTPAIWRRATRLSRERIENSVPMSFAEIQAEKDQLRAEFAMNTRRLEMGIDRLRETTATQLVEIDGQRAEIVRLSVEHRGQTDAIARLEQNGARLDAELKLANERLAKAREDIAAGEAALAERNQALASLRTELAGSQQLADEEKVELVARHTEIGNLHDRIANAVATAQSLTSERDRVAAAFAETQTNLADAQAALAAERLRTEGLAADLARLESERAERLAELERRIAQARNLEAVSARERIRADGLSTRVRELEIEREERVAELGRRAAEIESLADGDNAGKAIIAIEAENAALLARIASLESDIAAITGENLELHRLLSADREIESENSLLRDRLARVAADVVRLAGGPEIKEAPAIAPTNGNGHDREPEDTGSPAAEISQPVAENLSPPDGRTLAERLRALQHANN